MSADLRSFVLQDGQEFLKLLLTRVEQLMSSSKDQVGAARMETYFLSGTCRPESKNFGRTYAPGSPSLDYFSCVSAAWQPETTRAHTLRWLRRTPSSWCSASSAAACPT